MIIRAWLSTDCPLWLVAWLWSVWLSPKRLFRMNMRWNDWFVGSDTPWQAKLQPLVARETNTRHVAFVAVRCGCFQCRLGAMAQYRLFPLPIVCNEVANAEAKCQSKLGTNGWKIIWKSPTLGRLHILRFVVGGVCVSIRLRLYRNWNSPNKTRWRVRL